MKFRRIDKETVRCVLTEEDMRENGIEMDDFFKDRDKVRGFLEQLVERAKDEVGYEAKHGMLSLQIVPLPHNAVSITFVETVGSCKFIKIPVTELQHYLEGVR